MGLIGKLKNIFYDEEIVEVKEETPVREEKKEEIRKPRIEEIQVPKEEKIENTYSERELFKSEPTFKFPVIDEDDDEPVQTRSRVNTIDLEKRESARRPERVTERINETYKSTVKSTVNTTPNKERNAEKTFKPSPVISPVYGILDKNYTKEEIKEKIETTKRPSESEFNYDYVRRKAYGTLEDELENTLTKINDEAHKPQKEEIKEDDSKSIEELLSEIEENANISVGDLEEKIKDENEKEEEKIEKEEVKEEIKIDNGLSLDADDKTLEHDLFNLIDSMYEDREGE